jgi:hypothetical protein
MRTSRARRECDSAKDMTCHSWIIPMHGEKKQLERSCAKLHDCISAQNSRENPRPECLVIFSSRARRGEEDEDPGGFGSLVNAETVGS